MLWTIDGKGLLMWWQAGFATGVGIVVTYFVLCHLGDWGKTSEAPPRSSMTSAQEINDDIVQNLVVAQMALESGDDERSSAAVRCALEAARSLIDEMVVQGRDGGWERRSTTLVRGA